MALAKHPALAHLAATTRGNPYVFPPKPAAVPSTQNTPALIIDAEPPAKKTAEPVYVEIVPEVYNLPTYNACEFKKTTGYHEAWSRLNIICAAEPLLYREYGGGKDDRSVILVQVLDTMGGLQRIQDWVYRTFGGRVFVHGDDTVDDFLQITRAGHSFDNMAMTGAASAIFMYPTASVLDRLIASKTTTRLVVVVDDIYDTANRGIRSLAPRLVFVKPLLRGVLAKCCNFLRTEWRLPDRSQFWLTQAGADPRKLLHMMYFDRLNVETLGVSWRCLLDWEWERLVNFWFMYGPRRIFEYNYASIVNVSTNVPGVVSTQLRGAQGMSVSAWEFAVVPKTYQQRTELVINLDEIKGMALPYLHYAAPLVLCEYENITPDSLLWATAYAEVSDILSDADLQQNHFNPVILDLHSGAVREGLHRIRYKGKWKSGSVFSGTKPFYGFLETQKRLARTTPNFAPILDSYDHMARCLFLADPDGTINYWPTKDTSWAEMEDELLTHEISLEQQIAWRVLLATVRSGKEQKPTRKSYKLPPMAPVVFCIHRVASYHYCVDCAVYVKPVGLDLIALAPCQHGCTSFSWCFVCRKAPSDSAIRCESQCRGWGSCQVCSALNMVLARVVSCVRNMEKI